MDHRSALFGGGWNWWNTNHVSVNSVEAYFHDFFKKEKYIDVIEVA